jgi:Flp pilus assembly protein TadG
MRRNPEHRPARQGAVAPLTVLSLCVLVAVLALVLDGGGLLAERRHAQATADAAALAAAADLFTNYNTNAGLDPSGTAAASALAVAAANGYANDGTASVVTVNLAPQNYQGGPNAGSPIPAGYVEVLVQYNAAGTFSSTFQPGPVPVCARAVARGQLGPIRDGVVLLNLTGSSTLNVSGSASLVVQGAPLRVNSSSGSGINLSGSGSVAAAGFNLVQGSGTAVSGSSFLSGPGGANPAYHYSSAIADPLRYLSAPNPVALGLPQQGFFLNIGGAQSVDLYPGVYFGGIRVSGSATVTLHANTDGTPGIYYLQKALQVSGSAKVTTDPNESAGVMIYSAWTDTDADDQISVTNSASLTLNPPASGPYKGLTIFQQRGTLSQAAPGLSLATSGQLQVAGTVYAAYAGVTVSGSGNTGIAGGQYVVDSLTVSGSGQVTVDRAGKPTAGARYVGLVE